MTDKIPEISNFDSSNFIAFIYKWRKELIVVSLTAIIASVIFSSPFFIPPKYKANVIMIPTYSNSISKTLLSNNPGSKEDILAFGEEEQAEQMLQILNSTEIRGFITIKYNLMKHYDIDSTSKYKMTKLFKKYDNNISFRRTEYMAVEIEVYDTDPELAANIANDISALYDTIKNKMQRVRAIKALSIVENDYFNLRDEVKKMEDSLTVLRKLGVNDYESQAEVFNQQLAIAMAKGGQTKPIEDKIKILSEYGSAYVSLRDALENEKKRLSEIKGKYEEAKVDSQQDLPQKFVVSKAYKPEKKSYPIRWLIVVVSTLASIFIAIITIIILENTLLIKKKT